MTPQRVIALLGRQDQPTDAVEEYCRYLGAGLTAHNIVLQLERFSWETSGWPEAFARLARSAANWRGQWVLLQYTALAWSARGFPTRLPRVLLALQSAGVRVAVVFHDVEPFPGSRPIDRLRRFTQRWVMRRAVRQADAVILTVPAANLSWLEPAPQHATFIPVGPNLPIPDPFVPAGTAAPGSIAVFGITGGAAGARETRLIVEAVRYASEKLGPLRLSVFGRHAEIRESELRQGLAGSAVELSVEGVVGAEQVVRNLCASDVLLFVRGPISSRRGSAIAGIACGLPIVAFAGSETAAPVTDAGVILVPEHEPGRLNEALCRILAEPALRASLAAASRAVYHSSFSWPAIAAEFTKVLRP